MSFERCEILKIDGSDYTLELSIEWHEGDDVGDAHLPECSGWRGGITRCWKNGREISLDEIPDYIEQDAYDYIVELNS